MIDDHEAIVRAQYEAFRDRRREDSEALLAADFTFTSPYDDAISRAASSIAAGRTATCSPTSRSNVSRRTQTAPS